MRLRSRDMFYAILCYDSEADVCSWTKEQDDAAIQKLEVVEEKLKKQRRLGPVGRLMPTAKAKTLRKGRDAMLMDGPFAETKEQLLGFFIVDCATEDLAIEAARELGEASSSQGSYEIRPLSIFKPGNAT
jgi:hypothetical protein